MASTLKKYAKKSLIGLAVLFGLLQFTNPPRTNPPPANIVSQLRAACYDCHSNESRWPWYSRVAPVSWWVVDHVNDGREGLNFSEWPHDRPKRARSLWLNIRDEVEAGDMPLASFTWVHSEARLSATDREALVQWAEQEAARLAKLLAVEEGQ